MPGQLWHRPGTDVQRGFLRRRHLGQSRRNRGEVPMNPGFFTVSYRTLINTGLQPGGRGVDEVSRFSGFGSVGEAVKTAVVLRSFVTGLKPGVNGRAATLPGETAPRVNRKSKIVNRTWLPDMDLNHDKQIQS